MGPSHLARRLWLVAALTASATVAVSVLTISTRTGQLIGELILGGRPVDPAQVQELRGALTSLNIWTLLVAGLAIGGVALVQGRPRLAIAALVAVAGANVTTQILKTLVIERSDLLNGLFYVLPNSFPSGHATAAASLAAALLLVLPPSTRAPIGTVATIAAIVFAVATISAGWHRMADAVGGILIAVGWAAAAGAGLAMWRHVDPVGSRAGRLAWMTGAIMVAAGSVLAVSAFGMYAVVAVDPLDVLDTLAQRGGSPALYALGVALTVGVGLAAFGALTWALSHGHLDGRTREEAVPDVPASPSTM